MADYFQVNEWLETLLRIRDDQPRRFSKFSEGLKRQVNDYAQRKILAEKKAA